jgi:hypothetical protein
MRLPMQGAGGLLEAEGLGPPGQAEATARRRNRRAIPDPMARRRDPPIPSLVRFNSLLQEDSCEDWPEGLWAASWEPCSSGV